jgi:hypothetical protein
MSTYARNQSGFFIASTMDASAHKGLPPHPIRVHCVGRSHGASPSVVPNAPPIEHKHRPQMLCPLLRRLFVPVLDIYKVFCSYDS